jgi:hypothetical protein
VLSYYIWGFRFRLEIFDDLGHADEEIYATFKCLTYMMFLERLWDFNERQCSLKWIAASNYLEGRHVVIEVK